MVRADLGLGPWDVFHQGVAERTGLSIGLVVNLTAVVVLLLWIPLRQRPGHRHGRNVIVVGFVTDAHARAADHAATTSRSRSALLVAGILANAVATGALRRRRPRPGPRDGLMTGLAARGHSIRLVRTVDRDRRAGTRLALGGSVGVGTVAYALAIGPLVGYFMPADCRDVRSA